MFYNIEACRRVEWHNGLVLRDLTKIIQNEIVNIDHPVCSFDNLPDCTDSSIDRYLPGATVERQSVCCCNSIFEYWWIYQTGI